MKLKRGIWFIPDSRLGIKVPNIHNNWDKYSLEEQTEILHEWELERAKIPDRIKQLESKIIEIQNLMDDKEFEEFCRLHKEIINIASIINDLNIWYRTEGELTKTDK